MISGTVANIKKNPLAGANAYLEGTYDVGTTDENGRFCFETKEAGNQQLA